eukprot:TRINITY_DN36295_c0_g1_i1.p1 TRINITY_DN36295_c0_g1~~TRINITY_DN36295_c0_g1_i1.p1  ORF type:complete len:1109 (-),score=344.96 TRINITY_DN36295_c0_g1_i1:64-3390(-)
MGAGAGKKKYGQTEVADDHPGFDHNAWRTPKIKTPAGQVQLASERRDAASTWSPRQGGKKVSEIKAEKARAAAKPASSTSSEKMGLGLPPLASLEVPSDAQLGASRTGFNPALADGDARKASSKEYTPALGDISLPASPQGAALPSLMALGPPEEEEEATDVKALLEEMETLWKKLLLKRQGASTNMGALFIASQLKDGVQDAAKSATTAQERKAIQTGKVDAKIHALEDTCRDVEQQARPNIGSSAIWRRHELAVRRGSGLCEVMVAKPRCDVDVRFCVSGSTSSVERGQLVPLTKSQTDDFQKMLAEIDAAKSEQLRLDRVVADANKELRQQHKRLVEELEKELQELENNADFAPPGTVNHNLEVVLGFNGMQPTSPSQAPSPFPQMAGLVSAAEMMLKASQAQNQKAAAAAKLGGAKKPSKGIPDRAVAAAQAKSEWVSHKTPEGETYYHNERTDETAWELPPGAVARNAEDEEEDPVQLQVPAETQEAATKASSKAGSRVPSPGPPLTRADGTGSRAGSRASSRERVKAPSPTMPTGVSPPWREASAAAPKAPQKEAKPWREPGLKMPSPSAKFPPPLPKAAAVQSPVAKAAPPPKASPASPASTGLAPVTALVPDLQTDLVLSPKVPAAKDPSPASAPASESPAPAAKSPAPAAEPEPAPVSHWTEVKTEEGDIYYHNEETDETAWELPPGGVVKKPEEEASPSPAEEEAAKAKEAAAAKLKQAQESLKCPICNELFREAVLVICCGTNFCRQCAVAGMAQSPLKNSCPNCKAEVQQLLPNHDLRKRVEEAIPVTYWEAVKTDDGETYYFNDETGDTAWELPRGGKVGTKPDDAAEPSPGPAPGQAQSQAPSQAPNQFTSSQPQAAMPTAQFQHMSVPMGQVSWVACQAPDGSVYYYNQATGESSWELPADVLNSPNEAARAAAANSNDPWAGMYAAHAAEEAARQQREQYEAAVRQMQAAEEAARLQREQWDQMYAQHFAWYQQQQQQQQAQKAQGAPAQEAAAGLVPPGLDASMEDQIAFAMKCNVVQEMEEMLKQCATLAQRKKALKMWQIKWHPDKNPDQAEVAKSMFQFIGEKRSWFLHDTDVEGLGVWEDLPVDSPD